MGSRPRASRVTAGWWQALLNGVLLQPGRRLSGAAAVSAALPP